MKSILIWNAFSQKFSPVQSVGCCCSVGKAVRRTSWCMTRGTGHFRWGSGILLHWSSYFFPKLQIKKRQKPPCSRVTRSAKCYEYSSVSLRGQALNLPRSEMQLAAALCKQAIAWCHWKAIVRSRIFQGSLKVCFQGGSWLLHWPLQLNVRPEPRKHRNGH